MNPEELLEFLNENVVAKSKKNFEFYFQYDIIKKRRLKLSKVYSEPPIVEAICEFRFSSDTEWDLTVPGLVYDRIKKNFPKKSQHQIQNVEIKQEEEDVKQIVNVDTRSAFSTNDKKVLVQLGKRLLAINQLKPYKSWEKFNAKIDIALETLLSVVEIKGVQRIGLRYTNRIDIPGEYVKLEDYFNFRPSMKDALPKVVLSFKLSSHFPFADERDVCMVQLFSAPPGKKTNSFILDFDYYLKVTQSIESISLFDWKNEAHSQVEKLFEGCISDKLREIFKEVKR